MDLPTSYSARAHLGLSQTFTLSNGLSLNWLWPRCPLGWNLLSFGLCSGQVVRLECLLINLWWNFTEIYHVSHSLPSILTIFKARLSETSKLFCLSYKDYLDYINNNTYSLKNSFISSTSTSKVKSHKWWLHQVNTMGGQGDDSIMTVLWSNSCKILWLRN